MKLNVQKELSIINQALTQARNTLAISPHGSLRCSSSNGTSQYYVDGKYVSKKRMDLISSIAQREYLEELVPMLERDIVLLHTVENDFDTAAYDAIYDEMCATRKKLVAPLLETDEDVINKFMNEQYEPMGFEEMDNTEFYTINGERVRSKSEVIIANELQRYGVPYRYEKPLLLNDWGHEVIRRPDFTVLNVRTRKKYIFEHLGMMDKPSYIDSNMHKLDLYERNGYLVGKNLICTRETQKCPLNIAVLDNYIESFLI